MKHLAEKQLKKTPGLFGQCFESQTMNFCVLEEAAAQHAFGVCALTSASELQAAWGILESTKKQIPFLVI